MHVSTSHPVAVSNGRTMLPLTAAGFRKAIPDSMTALSPGRKTVAHLDPQD